MGKRATLVRLGGNSVRDAFGQVVPKIKYYRVGRHATSIPRLGTPDGVNSWLKVLFSERSTYSLEAELVAKCGDVLTHCQYCAVICI